MLLTKPTAPGKRASPLPGCMADNEPLGPPCLSAFRLFPPFSGDLGGPVCCSPPSVFTSPCCQVSLLPNWVSQPQFCFGGCRAKVFAAPCLGSPRPLPQSGNSGHQVPCIETSLPVSFSQISADLGGTSLSPSGPPSWDDGAHQFLHGRERERKSTTTCRRAGDPP